MARQRMARGPASFPQRPPITTCSRSQRRSGQGDGCGGGAGRRCPSSGGRLSNTESVAAKGPFLTSPSRSPPAGYLRTAEHTATLRPHTGLWGVV